MKKPEEIFEECKDLMDQLHTKIAELREVAPDKDHGMIASAIFDKGNMVDVREIMNGNSMSIYNMLRRMVDDDEGLAYMFKKVMADHTLHTQKQEQ